MNCKNPHNDGGTCPKCINRSPASVDTVGIVETTHDQFEGSESDDEDDIDSGADEIELPIVHVMSDHESDIDDLLL